MMVFLFCWLHTQAGSPVGLMLAGIAMQAQGAHRSAIENYMAVLQMGCDSRGLDKYAHYLLSEVRRHTDRDFMWVLKAEMFAIIRSFCTVSGV
jgi:hypothetical protein